MSWIACPLLLLAYVASTSVAIAANTLMMNGVINESGLACKSATLDILIPLLRKADPKAHKKLEESLKKGDCIQLRSGMPTTILGNDVHSKSAQTNYLIWHSNGKVYSVSENRVGNIAAVSGTSPPTTLPAAVAAPAEPVPEPSSVESPAPAGQETGAPFGYPLAATIGAALVVLAAIGMVVGRSVLAARSEAR